MIHRIRSRSNARVKALVKRKDRCFFFEGEKLVRDILERNIEISILVIDEKKENHLIIPGNTTVKETWYVPGTILEKISSLKENPGFIAVLKLPGKSIDFHKSGVIIGLDNIQDPGNAGTVFRCAAAFGVDAVALTGASVNLDNGKFLRTAQNSLFDIDFQEFADVESLTGPAEEAGLNIYTTSSHSPQNTVPPHQIKRPCLILFGNEGKGLGENLLDRYPAVRIPQTGKVESLNVGVSACIVMYELGNKD